MVYPAGTGAEVNHELTYLHPLAGLCVHKLCETCENGPECVQVARGLTPIIAARGGWLRNGRPCGRYAPEVNEVP